MKVKHWYWRYKIPGSLYRTWRLCGGASDRTLADQEGLTTCLACVVEEWGIKAVRGDVWGNYEWVVHE